MILISHKVFLEPRLRFQQWQAGLGRRGRGRGRLRAPSLALKRPKPEDQHGGGGRSPLSQQREQPVQGVWGTPSAQNTGYFSVSPAADTEMHLAGARAAPGRNRG